MKFTKTRAKLPENEIHVGADAPKNGAVTDRKNEVRTLLNLTKHAQKSKN
jgi:hypothetical protein